MIKDYTTKGLKYIWDYKFTLLTMIYIGLIAFVPIKFALSIPMTLHVLSFLFLIFLLAKTRYTFILTLLLAYILTFNAYFAFNFGTGISMEVMASIFETNKAEAMSMLKKTWLPALFALVATTALLVFAQKELKASKLPRKYAAIGLLTYLLIIVPTISYKRIKYEFQEELFKESPLRVSQDKLSLYAPILYGNTATILAYREEMRLLQQFANNKDKKLPEGVVLSDTVQAPQKIYLVIGESQYRKQLSLYGYSVKTTPFLDSLSQVQPKVMNFYEGIACAPFTRNALRMALSFASPRDMTPFYEEKTLLDLANDAGYETFWISNQGSAGIEDSYLGYLAAGANVSLFTKGGYLTNDDFDLIPLLREMHGKSNKQFFVIHLVGSHNDYSDRYDAVDEAAIAGNKSLTMDYDRSIHHTDRVLRRIYQVMEQDSTAMMLYFSDHGEIVGKGHGPWKNGRPQFEIPLLTIERNAPRTAAVVDRYIDKQSGLINNANAIFILAEVMGYQIPKQLVDKAIEDGRFVRHADQSYSPFADVKQETE